MLDLFLELTVLNVHRISVCCDIEASDNEYNMEIPIWPCLALVWIITHTVMFHFNEGFVISLL